MSQETLFEIDAAYLVHPIQVFRKEDGTIDISEPIMFIRMLRDTTRCTLIDGKNFRDNFVLQLNSLRTDPRLIRNQIIAEIDNMNDSNSLMDIWNYIKTTKSTLSRICE
jgi:hypothetical protein